METAQPFAPTAPAERHCAVFDTALGAFGIAWRNEAVTQVLLPLVDREATIAELQWQSGAELAPPPWPPFIADAVRAMQSLLDGEPADLHEVPLDWAGIGQFERKVYEATLWIPPGKVRTYDELADTIGNPGAARAVDVALARNPWPLVVPCHRVIAGGGRMGGHSAAGGIATKKKMLEIEAAMAARLASAGRTQAAR
ncbi:MAG: methylated-DNA--[protein]-cysteine S-methyltransferase [Rubrivivax sp.]|nr:methylated-DNA--[protein]-cysteine S-methyltransferase [Rubrivivax sp.]